MKPDPGTPALAVDQADAFLAAWGGPTPPGWPRCSSTGLPGPRDPGDLARRHRRRAAHAVHARQPDPRDSDGTGATRRTTGTVDLAGFGPVEWKGVSLKLVRVKQTGSGPCGRGWRGTVSSPAISIRVSARANSTFEPMWPGRASIAEVRRIVARGLRRASSSIGLEGPDRIAQTLPQIKKLVRSTRRYRRGDRDRRHAARTRRAARITSSAVAPCRRRSLPTVLRPQARANRGRVLPTRPGGHHARSRCARRADWSATSVRSPRSS